MTLAPGRAVPMSRTVRGATLTGIAAIVSWGALGLLGKLVADVPPLVVMAVCFLLAGAGGVVLCRVQGKAPAFSRPVLVSAGFITAYHLIYLTAFAYAPAIEVTLLNYLWPALFIIIGNLFFRLGSGARGFAGAGLGFAGVGLLIGPNAAFALSPGTVTGYGLAILAAAIWAGYSNIRRTAVGDVIPALTAICLISGLLCLAGAALTGALTRGLTGREMLWIGLLAVGPAGGAFFAWDYGIRHGNAALLSVLSFAAPLLSTAMLIAAGFAAPSWPILMAAGLIAAGGWVARR